MTGIGALSLALNQGRIARHHQLEAQTDALTGLLNRRALFDLHGKTPIGAFTAVVVFDLDGFKAINDQYGHAAGDEVLKVFAAELDGQPASRTTSPRAWAARNRAGAEAHHAGDGERAPPSGSEQPWPRARLKRRRAS